jgi:hypothetical protein
LATAAVFVLSSLPASAAVGQSLQVDVRVFGQGVSITLLDWAVAEADAGATLFASSSPGGTLLARVPLLPPYQIDLEAGILPTFRFNGVPPGNYFVIMVSGVVGAPAVPLSAWRQMVVSGCCSAAPGIGFVGRDSGQGPGTLRLFLASGDGCASTYELEAGTTPGASNIGTFTNLGQSLVVPTPPPGVYYVRARGRNAFGAGALSDVLPIAVPDCEPSLGQRPPDGPFNLRATVVGNNVTLTWTQSPGGPAQTFQELLLLHLRVGSQPVPTLLFPATATSVSATVPSGQYQVAILGGNACGKSDNDAVQFTVP